jgi:DNA-binding IclR family transcriptional regulator
MSVNVQEELPTAPESAELDETEPEPTATPKVVQAAVRWADGGARGPNRGVLAGAFRVLEELYWHGDAGLSQLSRATGLPKATTHRLLDQLVDLAAVERDGTQYRIGPTLLRFGDRGSSNSLLHRASRAACVRLTRAGHPSMTCAVVGVLRTEGVVAVESITSTDHSMVAAGGYGPLSFATGQVLVAHRPELGLATPFAGADWRRRRADILRRGVAFDHEENVSGICCVAAPVRLRDGRVVAALSAVVAARTVPPNLVDLTRRAAADASRNLAVLGAAGPTAR